MGQGSGEQKTGAESRHKISATASRKTSGTDGRRGREKEEENRQSATATGNGGEFLDKRGPE